MTAPLTAEEIVELFLHNWVPAEQVERNGYVTVTLTASSYSAIPRLLDEVERARALLKRIEWSGENDGGRTCPECGMTQPHGGEPQKLDRFIYGHRPDCELAALLG